MKVLLELQKHMHTLRVSDLLREGRKYVVPIIEVVAFDKI
jgi:hypothetical protein